MAIVGPRPESLAFADCFQPRLHGLLDYHPGLVGPSQVIFRSECMLYPAEVDAAEFYRRTLFPAKAKLDLDYYPRRTLLGDLGWIVRAAAAVCLPGTAEAQAALGNLPDALLNWSGSKSEESASEHVALGGSVITNGGLSL